MTFIPYLFPEQEYWESLPTQPPDTDDVSLSTTHHELHASENDNVRSLYAGGFVVLALLLTGVLLTAPVWLSSAAESQSNLGQPTASHPATNSMVPQDYSQLCDRLVRQYRPAWAPSGIAVQCVSHLKSDGKPVWGTYRDEYQLINISRDIHNSHDVLHTVVHEWAHVVIIRNGLMGTPRWEKWKKYLDEHISAIDPVDDPYYSIDYEILADAVATCEMDEISSPLGFTEVDCKVVYSMFPEFDPARTPKASQPDVSQSG